MKPKITHENVFDIPHYRNILNLLIVFQEHKSPTMKQRANGLEQKHFRYALCPNHDNMESYTQDRMYNFFRDKKFQDLLPPLYECGYLKPDCIKSRNLLTNFLDSLLKLKVVIKSKRGKKIKYRISKEYYGIGIRLANIRAFEEIDGLNITHIDEYNVNQVLYGFPQDIFNKLSAIKKNQVKEKLQEINKLIKEIEEIGLGEISDFHRRILILFDTKGNDKVKQFVLQGLNEFYGIFITYIEWDYEDDIEGKKVIKDCLLELFSYISLDLEVKIQSDNKDEKIQKFTKVAEQLIDMNIENIHLIIKIIFKSLGLTQKQADDVYTDISNIFKDAVDVGLYDSISVDYSQYGSIYKSRIDLEDILISDSLEEYKKIKK